MEAGGRHGFSWLEKRWLAARLRGGLNGFFPVFSGVLGVEGRAVLCKTKPVRRRRAGRRVRGSMRFGLDLPVASWPDHSDGARSAAAM